MRADGIGMRGRYFHFEGETDRLVHPYNPDNNKQFISTLQLTDLEMTFRSTKRDWCVLGSAGVRYANFEVDQNSGYGGDYPYSKRRLFYGYGPTASLELRRRCVFGLAPFVNARGSVLMGGIAGKDNFTGLPLSDYEPALNTYFEAQVGLEWIRSLPCGKFVVRGALEGQYSPLMGTTAEYSADNEGDHMQLGLVGVTLSAGLRF